VWGGHSCPPPLTLMLNLMLTPTGKDTASSRAKRDEKRKEPASAAEAAPAQPLDFSCTATQRLPHPSRFSKSGHIEPICLLWNWFVEARGSHLSKTATRGVPHSEKGVDRCASTLSQPPMLFGFRNYSRTLGIYRS